MYTDHDSADVETRRDHGRPPGSGRYRAELQLKGEATVEMRGSAKGALVTGKNSMVDVTAGAVEVRIKPLQGPVTACGFTLVP